MEDDSELWLTISEGNQQVRKDLSVIALLTWRSDIAQQEEAVRPGFQKLGMAVLKLIIMENRVHIYLTWSLSIISSLHQILLQWKWYSLIARL